MRKALILVVLALAASAAPAAAVEDPPFPVGACLRVTLVSNKPICVMVDPTK